MSTADTMMVIATFLGPVFGVAITFFVQNRMEESSRKLTIFRSLMKHRRSWIDPEHISALNVIEIEFHKDEDVKSCYKAFMDSLNHAYSRNSAEDITSITDQNEILRRNEIYNNRIFGIRKNLHTKLIAAMASNLRYKVQQIEILEGGYRPEAIERLELEQQAIRNYFVDLALNRRSVSIEIVNIPHAQGEE